MLVRSARRHTVRARCSVAAFGAPPGRMKFFKVASRASCSSIASSSAATSDGPIAAPLRASPLCILGGATCCLIDTLDQVGGQLTALYPEKYIFDVAGFPKVLAKDLVKGMAEQAFQFKAPVHLGQKVIGLKRESQNGKPAFTVVTETDQYPSRTVLIAGGIGAFTPRKLPLKDVDRWYGQGLHDRILDPRIFTGKRVLLVGGGDSAFDWAVNLQGVAQWILMIHRRDGFRAHAATVKQVQALAAAGKMELRTFWELKAIHGGAVIEAAPIFSTKTKQEERVAVDCVVPQLGFISALGPIAEWGLELEQGDSKVSQTME